MSHTHNMQWKLKLKYEKIIRGGSKPVVVVKLLVTCNFGEFLIIQLHVHNAKPLNIDEVR